MHKRFRHPGSSASKAFTLVELLVVVGIIGVLVGIVIPAVSAMWAQRLESETEMLVSGSLRSVQMQAKIKGERGLFFWVDPTDGVQRLAFIEAYSDILDDDGDPLPIQDSVDIFKIVDGSVKRIPAPYRVAPLSVLQKNQNGIWIWGEETLANRYTTLTDEDMSISHPNFFAIVFDSTGALNPDRSILIYDTPDNSFSPFGTLTQLPVDDVNKYFFWNSSDGSWDSLGFPSNKSIPGMIAGSGAAVNYGQANGVRGVLVYDGAEFAELAADFIDTENTLHEYLAMNGMPFTINSVTGNLIRGVPGKIQ